VARLVASVEGLPFQINQNLPHQPVPLHQLISPEDLRKLIKANPSATLHQLCEMVQKHRGIMMSTTAMCRLMKHHQIARRSPASLAQPTLLAGAA
jgi:hypothetical protein